MENIYQKNTGFITLEFTTLFHVDNWSSLIRSQRIIEDIENYLVSRLEGQTNSLTLSSMSAAFKHCTHGVEDGAQKFKCDIRFFHETLSTFFVTWFKRWGLGYDLLIYVYVKVRDHGYIWGPKSQKFMKMFSMTKTVFLDVLVTKRKFWAHFAFSNF